MSVFIKPLAPPKHSVKSEAAWKTVGMEVSGMTGTIGGICKAIAHSDCWFAL